MVSVRMSSLDLALGLLRSCSCSMSRSMSLTNERRVLTVLTNGRRVLNV